jgi:hypothetical protein
MSLLTHSKWKQRALSTALLTAVAFPVVAFAVREFVPKLYDLIVRQVPIIKWTVVSLSVAMLYTIVCMIICRKGEYEFNIEKMLHRGKYGDADAVELAKSSHVSVWQKLLGITDEFTKGDKFVSISAMVWNMTWAVTFIVVSILHFAFKMNFSNDWWAHFWKLYLMLFFILGIPVTVWITIGGIMDIKALFVTLSSAVRDHTDDGRVTHEPNNIDKPKSESGSDTVLKSAADEAK